MTTASPARKRRPQNPMSAEVRRAIEARGLVQAFASRPPCRRNDYLGWIDRARKPATRQRRLDQMLAELERGDCSMRMAWTGSGLKEGGAPRGGTIEEGAQPLTGARAPW